MLSGKKIISLCISRLHETENFRFVKNLGRKLANAGMGLFIYDLTADLYWDELSPKPEAAVFELIDFSITDILVVMYEKIKCRSITERLIKQAKNNNVPVIVLDAVYDDCCNICVDYKGAFEEIVRHVIGHHSVKKPHMLAGLRDNPFSDDRIAAFRKVIEENGMTFSEDMVSYGDFWAIPAKKAAEKIIADGNIPDALICANDIMAISAFAVFREHGYRIPEDLIITGFDGVDEIRFSDPMITSVKCGTSCFTDLLFKHICDISENGFSPCTDHVHPEMMINSSCGCKDTRDFSETDMLRSFNRKFYHFQDDSMRLTDMASKMLSASDLVEAAKLMFCASIREMVCLINKECTCTNITRNYFSTSHGFDDEMFLLFDNINPHYDQVYFNRKEIIPGLENAVNSGYPLIFNALIFMEQPVGYLCFCFRDYELIHYNLIPQIVNYLSYGIGGYINMQYQHYLNERISRIYQLDHLTGLHTRRAFMDKFEECRTKYSGSQLTVILTDLDGLKQINDKHGHAEGDNAIRTVACALEKSLPADSLSVRLGGDEMLAVIFGKCSPDVIKERIAKHLDEYNISSGLLYKVSASIGSYQTIMSGNTDFEKLVRCADVSMYTEKLAKKQCR